MEEAELKLSQGTIRIQSGQYAVDSTSWFDVRLTDYGVVLSLCDADMNVVYSTTIDGDKTVASDVSKLSDTQVVK